MLKDIIEVQYLSNLKIYLRFEDGVEGELDLSSFISFDGIFEPLREPSEFAKISVHPELGTVVWPNGTDLDPDVLYSKLTGKPVSIH